MIKVGIVGGTGYTGVELLRLLVRHPGVEIRAITSRSDAGTRVDAMFPSLRGHLDLEFSDPAGAGLEQCDAVFFATPNGVAMKSAPALLDAGVRVIDLAADYRLRDRAVWERWYEMTHASPEWIARAVYGLPEVNREALRPAQLVANPGCYPTAIQLGFKPLLDADVVDTSSLIADAKSGVSGAGRQAKVGSLMCEVAESFKAYAASGHRHSPEICQGLSAMTSSPVGLTFVPHLVPMIRGIEATLYAPLRDESVDLQALFERAYQYEPFVDVMPPGSHPDTRSVKGSNVCRIAVHRQPGSRMAIVTAVIDNLVKGAAGQAVHNLNIMFGLDERLGLEAPALLP